MSNGALRSGDTLLGSGGEHSGHYDDYGNPEHESVTITGKISSGSDSVFINGLPAARSGDTTNEFDVCCTKSYGSIGSGSRTVNINGKPAAREKDTLKEHTGSGTFTSASNNVIIGD